MFRLAARLIAPVANYAAVVHGLRVILRHRSLAYELAQRELRSQYAGQIIGAWWAATHPLFLMVLYVAVFAFVFKVKLDPILNVPRDYTCYLLAGLVPWLCVQQCIARAPSVLISQASLVKQVVFPLEVLPVSAVATNLVFLAVGLIVLVLYVVSTQGGLPWTYILLPILITLQISLMLGLSYALAAIGVFLRDVKDLVQIFSTAGVYLMPIFFLPQWVPDPLRPFMYLNPFSYMGWCY